MRYLHKYESHEDIIKLCERYHIVNYTINTDDSIDVDGNIYMRNQSFRKLPLKFGNVTGLFVCNDNELTSLEGCPRYVGNNFICAGNKLKSLEGCPKTIDGILDCYHNKLTSLKGCPKSSQVIYCDNNNIDTFEGLDFVSISGEFHCSENPIYFIWKLFQDHTKFEFFNDCDIIREGRVIILERLNFFLDYIGRRTVTNVNGYKCI
jgi:hypothetical protein